VRHAFLQFRSLCLGNAGDGFFNGTYTLEGDALVRRGQQLGPRCREDVLKPLAKLVALLDSQLDL